MSLTFMACEACESFKMSLAGEGRVMGDGFAASGGLSEACKGGTGGCDSWGWVEGKGGGGVVCIVVRGFMGEVGVRGFGVTCGAGNRVT